MTHLWDTDTCVYYLNGNTAIARKAVECGLSNICITAITMAELLYGAYNSQRVNANIARVNQLAQQLTVLETITLPVAEHFGKSKVFLKRIGQMVGDLDILIASFAQTHNLILVTNNIGHFQRFPGLRLENWAG